MRPNDHKYLDLINENAPNVGRNYWIRGFELAINNLELIDHPHRLTVEGYRYGQTLALGSKKGGRAMRSGETFEGHKVIVWTELPRAEGFTVEGATICREPNGLYVVWSIIRTTQDAQPASHQGEYTRDLMEAHKEHSKRLETHMARLELFSGSKPEETAADRQPLSSPSESPRCESRKPVEKAGASVFRDVKPGDTLAVTWQMASGLKSKTVKVVRVTTRQVITVDDWGTTERFWRKDGREVGGVNRLRTVDEAGTRLSRVIWM